MSSWDVAEYHSKSALRDTKNSLALIEPQVRSGDTVLDVGCGSAYVAWELARRHQAQVLAVDIVDCRRKPTPHFAFFDGVTIPFEDRSCDVVILSFVLHHVPNETKPKLMREVRRVTRREIVVLEDTPRNFIDRYFNRRHGRQFQAQIKSDLPFGFLSQPAWEAWFADQGFTVKASTKISRFARDLQQPYARSCFVLECS